MRTLAAALFAVLVAAAAGCDGPERPSQSRLKVGDPAPPLGAVKWLGGEGFTEFKPGTVYVLEFWATWCPPCVEAMPHLGELQKKFANDGVVIVPVTNADGQQSELDVEKYVRRYGPDLGLTFALSTDRAAGRAYPARSGLQGIPQSFVVDRKGKVAFIGRPEDLGEVLPKVIAPGWDAAP